MGDSLKGRKVAILATDGVEQVELVEPRKALDAEGAVTHLVTPKGKAIQAYNHHEKGDVLQADASLDDVHSGDYSALMLPGGVINPDALRLEEKAVQLVREFMLAEKPVAAICHGPWLLVEADAVGGRSLTSWPSVRKDIENAGGKWSDEAVVFDTNLVTSRKPEDIPKFNEGMVRVFAQHADERAVDAVSEQSFPASDPPPGPRAPAG
ncbi:MAG: intracellular protease, PfpI family [Gemmatimonadetes bacterium]|nr:intracellular protease, PfpI family [Gemmatimonadota bacterium]